MFRHLLFAAIALVPVVSGANEPPTVHLSEAQLPSLERIELEELWRVGGLDDDALFGVINSVLEDADGNLYILDSQLSEIQVYDRDGEYLRIIGREGEGPGEFRRASSMFMLGDDICVSQRFPGRIVILSPEGEPSGDFHVDDMEGMGGVGQGQTIGGRIVLARTEGRRKDNGFVMDSVLSSYSDRGATLVEYDRMESAFMRGATKRVEGQRKVHVNNWVLFEDGTICVGTDQDRYRLMFFAPEGGVNKVVELEYELLTRTSAEKKRIEAGFLFFGRRRSQRPEVELRDQHFAFASMQRGPDGNAWVLSHRGARPADAASIGIWETFDSTGQPQRRVELLGEGDPVEDAIFMLSDRVVVVRGHREAQIASQGGGGEEDVDEDEYDEAEPMEIIVYAIP